MSLDKTSKVESLHFIETSDDNATPEKVMPEDLSHIMINCHNQVTIGRLNIAMMSPYIIGPPMTMKDMTQQILKNQIQITRESKSISLLLFTYHRRL